MLFYIKILLKFDCFIIYNKKFYKIFNLVILKYLIKVNKKSSGSDETRTRDPLLVREVSYH